MDPSPQSPSNALGGLPKDATMEDRDLMTSQNTLIQRLQTSSQIRPSTGPDRVGKERSGRLGSHDPMFVSIQENLRSAREKTAQSTAALARNITNKPSLPIPPGKRFGGSEDPRTNRTSSSLLLDPLIGIPVASAPRSSSGLQLVRASADRLAIGSPSSIPQQTQTHSSQITPARQEIAGVPQSGTASYTPQPMQTGFSQTTPARQETTGVPQVGTPTSTSQPMQTGFSQTTPARQETTGVPQAGTPSYTPPPMQTEPSQSTPARQETIGVPQAETPSYIPQPMQTPASQSTSAASSLPQMIAFDFRNMPFSPPHEDPNTNNNNLFLLDRGRSHPGPPLAHRQSRPLSDLERSALGRRKRSTSPSPRPRKFRRARSVEPSPQHDSPGVPVDVVLQIMEHRYQEDQTLFLAEMHRTIEEGRRSALQADLSRLNLTQERLEAILTRSIPTDGSSVNGLDIDMEGRHNPEKLASEIMSAILKQHIEHAHVNSEQNSSSDSQQVSPPPRQSTSIHASRNIMEDEADDEDIDMDMDTDSPVLRFQKKGSKGKDAVELGRHLRTYLEEKRFRLPSPTKRQKHSPSELFVPQSPSKEAVDKFVNDNIDGPDKSSIVLDWSDSLSSLSLWNWGAISLIAESFKEYLTTKQTSIPKSALDQELLMQRIAKCLGPTKAQVTALVAPTASAANNLKKKMQALDTKQRRRARQRKKVEARIATSNLNEHRNPEQWKAARDALTIVGADCMSGEETDGPVKRGHTKCLVKVPVGWVNPQLADLFTVVDSYRWAVQNEGMSTGNRGNKPLPRAPQPKTAAYPPAVKGLPRNWYNDQWFKAQPPAQRALLKAAPARPIPSLQTYGPPGEHLDTS